MLENQCLARGSTAQFPFLAANTNAPNFHTLPE